MKVTYLTVLLFLTLLISTSLCKAQLLEYQKVIETPGLQPSQIIDAGNKWALKSYNNYQEVFQFKDTTTLVINGGLTVQNTSGKGLTFSVVKTDYKYKFQLEAKPGRCRVTITNFSHYVEVTKAFVTVPTREIAVSNMMEGKTLSEKWRTGQVERINREYDRIEMQIKNLINTLQTELTQPVKKDDW